MSKEKGIILAGVQLALFILLSGTLLAKGGLYIRQHEGDTLHLLQIVFRMVDGQIPHLDFVTPIGILAFAPMVLFTKLGFGVGEAFLWGQILVGAVFFPAIWYVSLTRLSGLWRYVFMAGMLVLCLGLIHGQTNPAVSVSMHYNRWAWAAAFLAIVTSLLPPHKSEHAGQGQVVDGIIIGLAFSVMALIKATYFAAFLPAVLVALATRGAWRSVIWALAGGLFAVAAMTAYVGSPIFWVHYLLDLLNVATSEVRSRPGLPFGEVLSSPAYLPGSLLALAGVILLRQAGQMREGLVMLLLLPGFFYVTYQNFGNDPQWIALLGILLIALRPDRVVYNGFGWDLRQAVTMVAMSALVLSAPSFLNIAQSPFRHLMEEVDDYVPMLPGVAGQDDLLTFNLRANRIDVKKSLDGPDTIFSAFYDSEARKDDATTFLGEELPWCSLELGMVAWFKTISDDLVASGLVEDKSYFVADLLPSYWLFGAGKPVRGAAPWYYGDLTGIENADLLLVPLCPLAQDTRKKILDEISEQPWAGQITELRRTGEYVLYRLPTIGG